MFALLILKIYIDICQPRSQSNVKTQDKYMKKFKLCGMEENVKALFDKPVKRMSYRIDKHILAGIKHEPKLFAQEFIWSVRNIIFKDFDNKDLTSEWARVMNIVGLVLKKNNNPGDSDLESSAYDVYQRKSSTNSISFQSILRQKKILNYFI